MKLRIAYCTGSGRFFILVPAVGDDHVKVASSTWSNDRNSCTVDDVATIVGNIGPVVRGRGTTDVNLFLTTSYISWLRAVVAGTGIRAVAVSLFVCSSASRCCKGDCSQDD